MSDILYFVIPGIIIIISFLFLYDMPSTAKDLERSRKEFEEEMKSLYEEIKDNKDEEVKDGRDKEVVDEVNDEDWEETREEARELFFNPFPPMPIPPPYPTQKQGKLISLRCTNCGGVLNPNTLTCEYCHTPHTII